jgi:hypothetical protein
MTNASNYQAGADAANRALDRTPLNASELHQQWLAAEQNHIKRENHAMAAYARGFADTVYEYMQTRGD